MSDNVPMTDNEKVNCYLEFYKRRMQSFDVRCNFEWKFNLALWAAIGIMLGRVIVGGVAQECGMNGRAFIVIHIVIFLLYVFVWSAGLQSANQLDRDYGFAYKDAVENFVSGKEAKLLRVAKPNRKWFASLWNWSPIMQILFTGGLLMLNVFAFWKHLKFWI